MLRVDSVWGFKTFFFVAILDELVSCLSWILWEFLMFVLGRLPGKWGFCGATTEISFMKRTLTCRQRAWQFKAAEMVSFETECVIWHSSSNFHWCWSAKKGGLKTLKKQDLPRWGSPSLPSCQFSLSTNQRLVKVLKNQRLQQISQTKQQFANFIQLLFFSFFVHKTSRRLFRSPSISRPTQLCTTPRYASWWSFEAQWWKTKMALVSGNSHIYLTTTFPAG